MQVWAKGGGGGERRKKESSYVNNVECHAEIDKI